MTFLSTESRQQIDTRRVQRRFEAGSKDSSGTIIIRSMRFTLDLLKLKPIIQRHE